MKGNLYAFLACIVVSCLSLHGPCRANYLYSHASCNDDGIITFTWHFEAEPNNPQGPPEWTGWDVMRRRTGENCEPWVRANDQPFPRLPGSHEHTYSEMALAQEVAYEYEAVPVDADRQRVVISSCWPCTGFTWASCPDQSAPLAAGTLVDWGWALLVQPCAGSCYEYFYFEGPLVQELRQYAGTSTVVRFYGTPYCGTIEGCTMEVGHYDFGSCGATPFVPSTWSGIKTIYR